MQSGAINNYDNENAPDNLVKIAFFIIIQCVEI